MIDQPSDRMEIVPDLAPTLLNVTIPAGQTLSSAADVSLKKLWRLRMPLAWNGGGSGDLTFQCSSDGIAYMDMVYRDGSPITAKVVPNTVVVVELQFGSGVVNTFLKLRASVPQIADRVFTLVLEG